MTSQLKAVAHPLRHNWVLYYDASHNNNNNNNNSNNNSNNAASAATATGTASASGENESEWDNALRDVCAFETVEDFWRCVSFSRVGQGRDFCDNIAHTVLF
jgi:hypothetical protein